jgi:hypothetical protein
VETEIEEEASYNLDKRQPRILKVRKALRLMFLGVTGKRHLNLPFSELDEYVVDIRQTISQIKHSEHRPNPPMYNFKSHD